MTDRTREAERLIERHRLERHPEGGWYRRVATSPTVVETPRGPRPAVTSILYLLLRGERSRPHRVWSDEVWHWLGGVALHLAEVVDSSYRETVLSAEPPSAPVHLVPAGAWQAAESTGDFTLVGCTVAPGFDFLDFEIAAGDVLDALLDAAPAMARFAR